MALDLLIAGGTLLDPASGRHESADVAVTAGRIVEIGRDLDRSGAREVLDANGLFVTPGLIDCHVHSYAGASHISFDADDYCARHGVTTAIDAGSSGMVTFPGFRQHIYETSRTRMLAFVHVAMYGATRDPGELLDLRFADVEGTAATIRANPDVAVGVKVRVADHHVAEHGAEALSLAIAASEAAGGVPIMVHIGHSILSIEEIVTTLRPGDIVTHCYTPLEPTLLDPSGGIRGAVLKAHERGVLFDVGPCDIDFDLRIARICVEGGLPPDLISTDAYVNRFPRRGAATDDAPYAPGGGPTRPDVDDLPTVIAIFHALGMSLDDAIARSTVAPARAIGWEDRLGALDVGREADLALLELVESPTVFRDSIGATLTADRTLAARWSIRAGNPVAAGA